MQPGQVFIIPIVQESWINALAENNLGRIDCASEPRPGLDELRKYRGSALAEQFGSRRPWSAKASALPTSANCPTGSVVIRWVRPNTGPKNDGF